MTGNWVRQAYRADPYGSYGIVRFTKRISASTVVLQSSYSKDFISLEKVEIYEKVDNTKVFKFMSAIEESPAIACESNSDIWIARGTVEILSPNMKKFYATPFLARYLAICSETPIHYSAIQLQIKPKYSVVQHLLTRSKDWDVPDGAIMRCTANSQPDIGSDTTLYAKPAYLLMKPAAPLLESLKIVNEKTDVPHVKIYLKSTTFISLAHTLMEVKAVDTVTNVTLHVEQLGSTMLKVKNIGFGHLHRISISSATVYNKEKSESMYTSYRAFFPPLSPNRIDVTAKENDLLMKWFFHPESHNYYDFVEISHSEDPLNIVRLGKEVNSYVWEKLNVLGVDIKFNARTFSNKTKRFSAKFEKQYRKTATFKAVVGRIQYYLLAAAILIGVALLSVGLIIGGKTAHNYYTYYEFIQKRKQTMYTDNYEQYNYAENKTIQEYEKLEKTDTKTKSKENVKRAKKKKTSVVSADTGVSAEALPISNSKIKKPNPNTKLLSVENVDVVSNKSSRRRKSPSSKTSPREEKLDSAKKSSSIHKSSFYKTLPSEEKLVTAKTDLSKIRLSSRNKSPNKKKLSPARTTSDKKKLSSHHASSSERKLSSAKTTSD